MLRLRQILIIGIVLLSFAGFMSLGLWGLFRLLPMIGRTHEAALSWFENRGPHYTAGFVIGVLLLQTSVLLAFVYRKLHAFDKSPKGERYWIYLTFSALAYSEAMQLAGYFLAKRFVPGVIERHPQYFEFLFRSDFVIALFLIGIGIYLFKQWSKILYGVAEIALAVLSNLALISRVNVSHAPRIHVPATDLIAICVFTYLLSKGIGDAVEGVQESRRNAHKDVMGLDTKAAKDGAPTVGLCQRKAGPPAVATTAPIRCTLSRVLAIAECLFSVPQGAATASSRCWNKPASATSGGICHDAGTHPSFSERT